MRNHRFLYLFNLFCFIGIDSAQTMEEEASFKFLDIREPQEPRQDRKLVATRKPEMRKISNPFVSTKTREINFNQKYILQGEKYPTQLDIRYFLWKGKFSNRFIFQDKTSVFVDLTSASGYGGHFTEYLYKVKLSAFSSVTGEVLKLIIKGVTAHENPDDEANNLNYLRSQKDVMGLHKSTNIHSPQLSLDLQNFWYVDQRSNEIKHFTILKKISGKMFYKYPEVQLPHIYEKVGRALGEMHYSLCSPLMKDLVKLKRFNEYITVCHHDFHGQNIFFNHKVDRVGFIDLESMAQTHANNVPYWHDIFLLYMREKYLDDNPKDYIQFNDWMSHFINGYVEAYPKITRNALKIDIIKRMKEWSAIFKNVIQSTHPKDHKDSLTYTLHDPVWFSYSIREDLISHKELTKEYLKATLEDNFEYS